MQLNGLTANTDYIFYYFNPTFGPAGRTGTLSSSFDDFANTEDTSASFDQNATSTVVSYTYNTGSNTSLYIRANSTGASDLHTYGFYNAVAVPEPSTTALLGLGGLALILRRRK